MLVLFFGMVIGTWERWASPFVDHGREMNLPIRILAGERLYVDVTYQYGPLAPYANALLYAAFGIRLMTLHVVAMITAIVILFLCYRVCRRMLGVWESAVTTSLIVVLSALAGPSGNYIQPYAFSALYGWMFSLCALLGAIRFAETGRTGSLIWAGCWIGATIASKPEFGLQAGVPTAMAWALRSHQHGRWQWRHVVAVVVSAVMVTAVAYTPILLTVPWDLLVTDMYFRFTAPQMLYFARVLNGTLAWPRSGWAVAAGVGDLLTVCSATALFGLVFAPGRARIERRRAWLLCGLLGVGSWMAWFRTFAPGLDHHLLRSAPLVLAAVIAWLVVHVIRLVGRQEPVELRHQALLLTAAFAVIAIVRVPLNISLVWAYTPFTLPALLIVFSVVLLRASPQLLLPSAVMQRYARGCTLGLMLVIVAGFGTIKVLAARNSNVIKIDAPRGRFFTTTALGRPLQETLAFVNARTVPGEFVASLPQGTVINFLTGRPNPLREENIVPGFLTSSWEHDTIERLTSKKVRLILVANVLTPEYRDRAFGVDYNQTLLRWIQTNYREVATFGPEVDHPLHFGDSTFFIRAFEQ